MSARIVVSGAAGRMGRRIIALAAEDRGMQLVGAMEAAGSPAIGKDAGELAGIGRGGLSLATAAPGEFDVLIDFSTPSGTMECLRACVARGRPLVIGTTGHDEQQIGEIRNASRSIAVLKAANMSVGVNVLLKLVEEAARLLDVAYDVEITETHHRFKIDAPSGTALALIEAVRRGRAPHPNPPLGKGRELAAGATSIVHGRRGAVGQRPAGEIGVHSLRVGDTVGEHIVQFGSLGETISISHSAHSRDTFASGALRAAKWMIGRPAGLYGMNDVLFGNG